jgi:hypothetical protein
MSRNSINKNDWLTVDKLTALKESKKPSSRLGFGLGVGVRVSVKYNRTNANIDTNPNPNQLEY